jgi:dCTP deaminase
MTLSDRDLAQAQLDGKIVVEPFEREAIQPASIDLRLGYEFAFWEPLHEGQVIDLARPICMPMNKIVRTSERQHFDLGPGQFALACTFERVAMDSGHRARVEGKSSLGRLGLLVHATAGFIDPGFDGQITLEIYNLSPHTFRLRPTQLICQLEVARLTSPAAKSYGAELGSKYNGQTGVTESRWKGFVGPG